MSTKGQPELSYYYLRDEDNHPIACVAIGQNEDRIVSRGIAICSTGISSIKQGRDQWSKKEGRKRATARCRRAMGTKGVGDQAKPEKIGVELRNRRPIPDSVMSFMRLFPHFVYKSAYGVVPTEREANIITKANDARAKVTPASVKTDSKA